jgi:hypothetical protein
MCVSFGNMCTCTVCSESFCALRLRYVVWLAVSKFPLKYAVVSLHSVVKQRLKCNIGKACNCLIQFLLTAILSIEERAFLVEYVFREGNRWPPRSPDLTPRASPSAFSCTCTCACTCTTPVLLINLLKPTGYVTHQQFNIQQL